MPGHTYYYYISYDEKKDDFFGMIDSGPKSVDPLYTIDSTEHMLELITDGIMNHIDDVDGLEKYLKKQGFMGEVDSLVLSEKMLW